jgi:hypothetical protein
VRSVKPNIIHTLFSTAIRVYDMYRNTGTATKNLSTRAQAYCMYIRCRITTSKGVHKYGSILYYISCRFLCPPCNRVNHVLFSMYIPTYALIFLQPSVLVKLPRICRNCFYKIIISLCYRFSLIVFIVHTIGAVNS